LLGNPGDVRPIGEGVSELRINYGPRLSRLLLAARRGACPAVVRRRQSQSEPRHWACQAVGARMGQL